MSASAESLGKERTGTTQKPKPTSSMSDLTKVFGPAAEFIAVAKKKRLSDADTISLVERLRIQVSSGKSVQQFFEVEAKNAKVILEGSVNPREFFLHGKPTSPHFVIAMAALLQNVDLQDAFEFFPRAIRPSTIAVITRSIASGTMESELGRLADYLRADAEAKRKMKSVLFYPIFAMGFSVLVCLFILLFVVPAFRPMYEAFLSGGPLPFWPRLALGLSGWLDAYWYVPILLTIGIPALYVFSKRTFRPFREMEALVLFRYCGPISRFLAKGDTVNFLGLYSTLASSGIPLAEAFFLSVDAVENLFLRDRLQENAERFKGLEAGFQETHLVLAQVDPIFGPHSEIFREVKVATDEGVITHLQRAVAGWRLEMEYEREKLTLFLQQAAIIFVGGVVLFILLLFFLPLFSLYATMAR